LGPSAKQKSEDGNGTGRIDADKGMALARRARNLREREAVYFNYVDVSASALAAMAAARTAEFREEGQNIEAHDTLLAQLKGLRTRFSELDALARSLLLLAEEKGDEAMVWEEVLAVMNALQALEMEARAAQSRAALAAVFRDYMGEKGAKTRKLSLEVNSHLVRRFNALAVEVRDIQAADYGRKDSFTHGNLLERLVALGSANPGLLVQMGAPHEIPVLERKEDR